MDTLKFAAVSRNYFNMPIWIAQHAGFLEDERIDISLELYEGINEVTDRLRDGRVQLAFGVTENVILDSEAGGTLEIIGGNVNKLPFSFIARKGISTFGELRGKTIGVSAIEAGSSSLVMQMLADQGLHYPRDYHLRAVGPILTRWKMLQSGEIDAGLQGAPLNFIAMDQGYAALGDSRERFPDFQFTSLNVDSRWATQNRDLMVRFMRAFVRAHSWFYTHRSAASTIAVAESRIEHSYALRAWDEYVQDQIFPRDGDAGSAAVQALIDISALIRAIPSRSKANADGYINRDYLRAAWDDLARTSQTAAA
ncbi:MAG TPA: ABC transporter substrate-binding protein [Magnetospirillaceae bacterium]|jgi:ABC-type nitrate/sulfonate/bicarbonate transport system substrate-binding protein